MGMTDTVTKEYMRGNRVFADAFNYLIYGGEQVVKPALLQELDTTEIAIPFALDEEENTTEEAVQKYRDVLKSTVIMQDAKASYILLGVENQTDVHYAMPVRNIIYDALQYGKQVSEVAKKHKNQSDGKRHNRGEYLSGFYKEDRIRPVITLVIHFGANKWDGPLSLYEMMDLEDEKLLDAHGGGHAVHKGNAACDLGQGVCHGVFLAKDVHIAEVAQERVRKHVQQQAGGRGHDHLDEVTAAVLVQLPQLEGLMGHRAASDADDELEHKGGDGVARVTGQDVGQ